MRWAVGEITSRGLFGWLERSEKLRVILLGVVGYFLFFFYEG